MAEVLAEGNVGYFRAIREVPYLLVVPTSDA